MTSPTRGPWPTCWSSTQPTALGVPVTAGAGVIELGGASITVESSRNPATIDWGALGADIVIESTGRFRARDDAARHLKGGARKVLISAPGKNADLTVVVGVNHGDYDPDQHDVISAASCTTNCVAPMAKVLNDSFGLVKGFMTTVHAYTGDQNLIDAPHKDPRRARSAAVSMIPTTTGAAKTTGQVIPELAGRLDGIAVRVPVEDGSLTDLTAVLGRDVTAEQVNEAFHRPRRPGRWGTCCATAPPRWSPGTSSATRRPASSTPRSPASGRLVKIYGWYDNEWGYTCRLADLAKTVGRQALAAITGKEGGAVAATGPRACRMRVKAPGRAAGSRPALAAGPMRHSRAAPGEKDREMPGIVVGVDGVNWALMTRSSGPPSRPRFSTRRLPC